MSLKLTNNLFLRTMLRNFNLLAASDAAGQPLTPYFQYKIGPYRNDHFLYFKREPNWLRYKCEAFDKLNALAGYDIPRYLDFHYSAYADKEDFRRFLRYEMANRLTAPQKDPGADYQTVLQWLEEQEARASAKISAAPAIQVDESVMELMQEKLSEMGRSFAGKIVITDPQQLEGLIQLLILLKDLRAPGKTGEALFSSFSTTDLAAILRQFTELKDYKLNTLQKKIAECNAAMHANDRIAPLQEALIQFFFGQ
jgi:hypothetical protein